MSYLVHRFSMGYLCPRKLDERKKKKGVLQDLCFLLGITFASSSKRKRVRFLFIFKSKECTGHTWDHKTIVFNFLFYLALDVKKKTHEEKEDFKKMSLNTITMKHQFKKKKIQHLWQQQQLWCMTTNSKLIDTPWVWKFPRSFVLQPVKHVTFTYLNLHVLARGLFQNIFTPRDPVWNHVCTKQENISSLHAMRW